MRLLVPCSPAVNIPRSVFSVLIYAYFLVQLETTGTRFLPDLRMLLWILVGVSLRRPGPHGVPTVSPDPGSSWVGPWAMDDLMGSCCRAGQQQNQPNARGDEEGQTSPGDLWSGGRRAGLLRSLEGMTVECAEHGTNFMLWIIFGGLRHVKTLNMGITVYCF